MSKKRVRLFLRVLNSPAGDDSWWIFFINVQSWFEVESRLQQLHAGVVWWVSDERRLSRNKINYFILNCHQHSLWLKKSTLIFIWKSISCVCIYISLTYVVRIVIRDKARESCDKTNNEKPSKDYEKPKRGQKRNYLQSFSLTRNLLWRCLHFITISQE